MSFWDIENKNLNRAIDPNDIDFMLNLKDKIREILKKNFENYWVFENIVDEEKDDALDYYNLIVCPMSLSLIEERLKNCYYLNNKNLLLDLDLIQKNAELYNNNDSLIAKNAKKCVQEIKYAIEILRNSKTSQTRQRNNIKTSNLSDSVQVFIDNKSSAEKPKTRRLTNNSNNIQQEISTHNNTRSLRNKKEVNYNDDSHFPNAILNQKISSGNKFNDCNIIIDDEESQSELLNKKRTRNSNSKIKIKI